MSSRKIVGSEIIEQRQYRQTQNNLWYYVDAINDFLGKNPINTDKSIDIEFFFSINQHMIDQIVETYEGEGWIIDVGITTLAYRTYSGHTQFNFIPASEVEYD